MNLLDLVVTVTTEDKASDKIEGLGTKSIAMGTAIGTTVGNLVSQGLQKAGEFVVEFGKETINAGMDFDKAMSQVAATMGVTNNDIQDLTKFAKEMGSTTAFSATEAAEALNYMALAGYDSETSMKMLPNVLNLAAAGSMDLATASDMVTDSQTALGLSIDETNTLVDQMAQTSSKSNTSVQQLGDAILTIGGTAKNMSGGITEMNAVLGVLADNGIKGSEAGTHLRNIILSLSAPTDNAAATLEQLGISATDAEGNMRPLPDIMEDLNMAMDDLTQEEKTQALNTIFNKTDLSSVNALLSSAANNVDGIADALLNTGVSFMYFDDAAIGAEEQARGMAVGISEAIGQTNGDIEKAAQLISETYNLSFEDAMKITQAGGEVIANTSDRFDELTGYINDATGAAEQMAQTQLDNLAGDMTLLQSATEGVQLELSAKATPALREMAQAGSTGLSEMAAKLQSGDLLGGFQTLGTTAMSVGEVLISKLPEFIDMAMQMIFGFIDGIGQGLDTLIPTIVQAISGMISSIISNIPVILQAGVSLIKGLIQGIMQAYPVIIEMTPQILQSITTAIVEGLPILINGVIELFNGIVQALPQVYLRLVEAMPQVITALVVGLTEALPVLIEGFVQLFVALVGAVPQFIQTIVPMIPQIIEALANGFIEAAPQIIDAFGKMLGELPKKAMDLFSDVLKNAGQFAGDMVKKAQEVGSKFLEKVVEFFRQLPGKIAEFCSNVIRNIGQWVSQMVQNARNMGSQFLQNVINFFQQLPGNIANFLSNVISNIANWVSNMGKKAMEAGRSFLQGVQNTFQNVVQFFRNLPSRIISAIGNAGSMLLNVGRNIIQGLINGITGMVGNAISAVTNTLGNIVNSALSFLGIHSPSRVFAEIGDYSMQGLAAGFKEGSEQAADTLDGILDDMSSNSVTVGVKGGLHSQAEKAQEFVFNVTINTDTDAIDYGRKIGESLFETMKRRELNYA